LRFLLEVVLWSFLVAKEASADAPADDRYIHTGAVESIQGRSNFPSILRAQRSADRTQAMRVPGR